MQRLIRYFLLLILLITAGCSGGPAPDPISPTVTRKLKPTLEITDADLQGRIAVCVNSTDGIRVMQADGSQVSEPIT